MHFINFFPLEGYCPFAGTIDLSVSSGLRILDIEIVFPSRSSVLGGPLVDFCRVLQTIPQKNSVEEIKLGAYIGFYSSKQGPASCFQADWDLVDSALIRISDGRPLLFHLHFVYSFDEGSDTTSDGDEMEVERALHGEVERHCAQVFRRLVQERFPLVNTSSDITLILSHDVVID